MFGIPLPYLLLGLSIALFGTYRGGYHYGWADRDHDMKIAIAKKNEESRKTEQQLNEQINQNATKLLEATNAINQKTSALAAANRAGKLRLCPTSYVQAPTSASVATTDTKATSEPDRQTNEPSDAERATIEAIAEIVAQGDRNTIALNACVDSYNDVRNLLNDKR
jgi:predicted lipid-binding transport protein (Tim44 family)